MRPELRCGIVAGLGYGVAVATVDLGFGTWNFVRNNLPAFTGTVLVSVAIQLALGALLGLVASPLVRDERRAGPVHLAAITALWLAVAWWTAVDREAIPMWASPAAIGAVLVLLAALAGRRRPALPAVVGCTFLLGLCFAPMLWQSLHDTARVRKQRPVPARVAAGTPAMPDVVVVVLDTVRAASMSAYGYGLPTTPNFDALAAGGALFLDASAPSTWSLPSHASLFTGVFPSVHGAHAEHRFLDDRLPTLAETLSAAGYQTLAFTANPWISDHLGLTRGFDWSDEAWRDGGGGRAFFFSFRLLDKLGFGPEDKGGGLVARNFEDWVAGRPADAQPAFAFLNFLEAHFPHHQLPEEYLRRFTTLSGDDLHEYSRRLFATQFGAPMSALAVAETRRPAREMYDAGVAYTDALLGRLVEALRRRGSLDRTLFVVLADHGEMLGEHGEFGHGIALYQPTMRVPLLLRLPGVVKPARVPAPVSTAAVFASVLDALGLEAKIPGSVPSLLPVIDGRPGGAPVICERFSNAGAEGRGHPLLDGRVRLRAYRSGQLKLVENSAGAGFLFDLANDPDEDHDLAAEKPDELARVKTELATWRAAMGIPELGAPGSGVSPSDEELDPEAKERLRALGYVE